MIKNREQLLQLSADWATRAKNDIRSKMIEFIEASGMNQAQLSDVLGMSMGEIEQILNGNGEITLTTFAKLLIATDHVLEIKPLAVSQMAQGMPRMGGSKKKKTQQPRDRYGRFIPQGMEEMPMVDGYPHPQMFDGNGKMMPPPPMFDGNGRMMPPPPMFDRNGRMMPPPPMFDGNGGVTPPPHFCGMPGMRQRQRVAEQEIPQPQVRQERVEQVQNSGFDAMDRRALVNVIRENHWDTELDLINSTRSEMIDFLNAKQSMMAARQTAQPQQNVELDESEKIGQMLAAELERNPHLRDVIQKYI